MLFGNENNTFTLEFVKSRLFQEEQRMKMRMEATNVKCEASALVKSHPDSQSSRTSASIAVGKTIVRIGAGKRSLNLLQLGFLDAGTVPRQRHLAFPR